MSQAITRPAVYLNITDANTQPTVKQIRLNKEKTSSPQIHQHIR